MLKYRYAVLKIDKSGCCFVCLVAQGWYCHIWVILAYAAVKGMVFKQFSLGQDI